MKNLHQVTVLGTGLLGASLTLALKRAGGSIKTAGYSHRESTREKARGLDVADIIYDKIEEAVASADMVILATPILTFEKCFKQIAGHLKEGCIVTDVGSTKVLPHRWAKKILPGSVFYVGSHPIAGSEKRGVEFARDDLFAGANCIVTTDRSSNPTAVATVKAFWAELGALVYSMSPAVHDRTLGHVSHVPHITAAALINAGKFEELKLAGKGFLDTSRIASGPANIWTDILITNPEHIVTGLSRVIKELEKMKSAVESGDARKTERLLEKARQSRSKLVNYKIARGEILS